MSRARPPQAGASHFQQTIKPAWQSPDCGHVALAGLARLLGRLAARDIGAPPNLALRDVGPSIDRSKNPDERQNT